jgi:predicted nuclease of predicted toxin-antitoxin system
VKVLLDENLAHRLRRNLGAHEVLTVSFRGWAGLKNGELLRIAEENGIEVLLTGDQTLSYEQNLKGRTIAIGALSSVEWDILKNHLPPIIAPIDSALPGTFQAVDCGTFSRKK